MSLQLDDLDLLTQPATSGAPRMLPVASIDEDVRQPRLEFDEDAMAELADSIRQRGVRQPVSVRRSPHPGRWTLNFGARRLRASRLIGLTEIPAFEDNTADSFDQLMENEQRAALTPLEVALFVKRHLDAGMSKSEIAQRMAKSKTHVTMLCALIDAPDWLMEMYRSGACRGIRDLYELRKSGCPPSPIPPEHGDAAHTQKVPATSPGESAPPKGERMHDGAEPSRTTVNDPSCQPAGNPGATPEQSAERRAADAGAQTDLLRPTLMLCDRLDRAIQNMKQRGLSEAALPRPLNGSPRCCRRSEETGAPNNTDHAALRLAGLPPRTPVVAICPRIKMLRLSPTEPPGRLSRKARAYAVEIHRLRDLGYTMEVIQQVLADAGLHVSKSTVQREAARAARRHTFLAPDDGGGPEPPGARGP